MSSRITTPSRRVAAIGAIFALIVALVATGIAVGENISDGGSDSAAAPSDASDGTGKQGDAAAADPEQQKMYDQFDKATVRREDGDALALGKKDAPVVLVEYADYQCSYCGRFTRETQPELVKKYVDDGTLRIEFRNFPIFGKDSERAARASWAAGRQGKFWAFHDELYAKLRKGDALAEDKLVDLARKSGVGDVDRFREDLKGSAAAAAVKKDQNEAYSLGVQSTPSFVVGGRPIAGAQPMSVFEEAIKAARDHAKAAAK
ncbi:thioredoxin domain-containing protein [Streptomyces sp. NPDC050617]|uniref:DsbA family protein n=1 Tax=Streptomyces sp. NPDC050617 TaxID=3154628 RepID=UPI003422C059